MLMAKGKIIFFNEASLAVDYFISINFKCPELSNPSDYFMSIMSFETIEQEALGDGKSPSKLAEQGKSLQELYQQRINTFSRSYEGSELRNDPTAMDATVQPLSKMDNSLINPDAGWFYQFGLLAQRNFLNIMRLP